MADLVFSAPASSSSTDLVFGATSASPIDTTVTVFAPFALEVDIHAAMAQPVTVQAANFPFEVHTRAQYVSGASRPLVGEVTAAWQAGVAFVNGLRHLHTAALPMRANARTAHEQALPARSNVRLENVAALPQRRGVTLRHQDGQPLRSAVEVRHQDALAMRRTAAGRFQQGVPLRRDLTLRHQDGLRDRKSLSTGRWQQGVPTSLRHTGDTSQGLPFSAALNERHQQAMKPPPGIWDRVIVVPPQEPCYTPSGHLVFSDLWDGSPHLLFVCDPKGGENPEPPAQIVVPVRRVYIVINETSLWRVDGNVMIPTFSMSLSLDVDSWTWSFSASVPGAALSDLEPANFGEPVELEARINGSTYRLLAESLSRERTFGTSRLTVRGRGKSAVLDAPYSAALNFGNTSDMTAQQLMNDVLTLNNVSIGWDVDWTLTDWFVPADVWKMQGTYIAAVNAIAGAAGGYVQPHPTEQVLRVLHRYPVAPWEWGTVEPDFELPSAYTTREGLEWVDKPRYNRVYVSGQSGGVLGQVTRAGTAGDLMAPMITDALITHADAARQRGLAVLADVGRQAKMTLRTPTDITGVIEPGKFVRYVDGASTRLGIVRSTAVDVSMPEVWQTLTVETHE